MKRTIFNRNFYGIWFLLFLFWIAVSGSVHWQQLLLGAAAALFVAAFNRDLLIGPEERPPVTVKTALWLAAYILRLLGDIVKANFQVAAIVLSPRMPISPCMVHLDGGLKRAASRVLLGNSITLTPGTLTVLADRDHFVVHALTGDAAEGLAHWALIGRLQRMEGDTP